MSIHSKITSKGQTTIPVEVREALCLNAGDRVEYIIREGKVELFARNLRAADLAGILGRPPSGETLSLQDIDDAIGAAASADDARIAGKRTARSAGAGRKRTKG